VGRSARLQQRATPRGGRGAESTCTLAEPSTSARTADATTKSPSMQRPEAEANMAGNPPSVPSPRGRTCPTPGAYGVAGSRGSLGTASASPSSEAEPQREPDDEQDQQRDADLVESEVVVKEARPSSRASRARIVLFSVFTVALCATLHEAPACRTDLPRGEFRDLPLHRGPLETAPPAFVGQHATSVYRPSAIRRAACTVATK